MRPVLAAWREEKPRGPQRPSDLFPHRPEEAGAEVPVLPLDALQVLAEQLDEGDLEQTLLLLKLFIVLCRWVPVVVSEVGRAWSCGPEGAPAYFCDLSHPSLPRNPDNVEAGWGRVLVPRVLALLTRLVAKVRWAVSGGAAGSSQCPANPLPLLPTLPPQLKGSPPPQEGQGPKLEEVALHALLLSEGLFDPYQTWRRQHSG